MASRIKQAIERNLCSVTKTRSLFRRIWRTHQSLTLARKLAEWSNECSFMQPLVESYFSRRETIVNKSRRIKLYSSAIKIKLSRSASTRPNSTIWRSRQTRRVTQIIKHGYSAGEACPIQNQVSSSQVRISEIMCTIALKIRAITLLILARCLRVIRRKISYFSALLKKILESEFL